MRESGGVLPTLATQGSALEQGIIICPFKDEPCFPASCVRGQSCYYLMHARERIDKLGSGREIARPYDRPGY